MIVIMIKHKLINLNKKYISIYKKKKNRNFKSNN